MSGGGTCSKETGPCTHSVLKSVKKCWAQGERAGENEGLDQARTAVREAPVKAERGWGEEHL